MALGVLGLEKESVIALTLAYVKSYGRRGCLVKYRIDTIRQVAGYIGINRVVLPEIEIIVRRIDFMKAVEWIGTCWEGCRT